MKKSIKRRLMRFALTLFACAAVLVGALGYYANSALAPAQMPLRKAS